MAFQIQYPPLTPSAMESFMKGYQGVTQAKTAKLEQQMKRKEIDSYDRRIAVELESLLAGTEATKASTEVSKQDALLKSIEAQYKPQSVQADIALKEAQAAIQSLHASNPELFAGGEVGQLSNLRRMQGQGTSGMDKETFKGIESKIIQTMGMTPAELAAADVTGKAFAGEEKMANEDAKAAESLQKKILQLKGLRENIPGLMKGPILNKNPAKHLNKDVDSFNRISNEVVAEAARMLQSGHINDSNFALVSGSKPELSQTEDSFQYIANTMLSTTERLKERAQAFKKSKDQGLSQEEAHYLFQQYNYDRPANGSEGPNFKFMDSFDDYLKPEVVETFKAGGSVNPELIDPTSINKEQLMSLPEQPRNRVINLISKINKWRGEK